MSVTPRDRGPHGLPPGMPTESYAARVTREESEAVTVTQEWLDSYRPTPAPDTTAGDRLWEAIAGAAHDWEARHAKGSFVTTPKEFANAVLALPALRDLIAERDQAVATLAKRSASVEMLTEHVRVLRAERDRAVAAVERVRGVLDALDETAADVGLRRPVVDATVVSRELRRALDPQ